MGVGGGPAEERLVWNLLPGQFRWLRTSRGGSVNKKVTIDLGRSYHRASKRAEKTRWSL